ncbi:hypothetical protein AB4144_06750 [Rhizobiaceae sp. 2RAB30]
MAKMKDILDSEEARANREANLASRGEPPKEEHPEAVPTIHVEEPQEDDRDKAKIGPLGAFFKRRAEFLEQEAFMLAIQLERLYQGKE